MQNWRPAGWDALPARGSQPELGCDMIGTIGSSSTTLQSSAEQYRISTFGLARWAETWK